MQHCRTTQADRDRLLAAKWQLQLEIDRFLKLEKADAQERQAGSETMPYERAILAAGADASFETLQADSAKRLQTLLNDLLAAGFNKRMAARELAAWISGYPLKDNDLRGDDADYRFNGISRSKPEHLFDAARMQADEEAWETANDLMARIAAATAESQAARFRKEVLELEAKWASAHIALSRQKAQIDHDSMWEKIHQAVTPGGILDYKGQIGRVDAEYLGSLREAASCLISSQRRLETVYGYPAKLPQPGTPGYFAQLTAWTAGAKARMARFHQLDQTYTMVLSLKDVAKSQWDSGKSSGEWSFELPAERFPGQSHVRLVGLGLAAVGATAPDLASLPQKSKTAALAPPPVPPKPAGFWNARVAIPAAATVIDLTGKSTDLDQKLLPEIHLGRVADRDAREPEVAGAAALRDASPIGKSWKITISPQSTDGTATASLADVQLYLQLAVRSAKVGT